MPLSVKLAIAALIFMVGPSLARADYTYAVTQTDLPEEPGSAAEFSFVVPTITPFLENGFGYPTPITNMSGAIVGDFQLGKLGTEVPACGRPPLNGPAVFFHET
jgi:hypothetical protein